MITLDKVTEALQTGKRPKGGAVKSGVPSLGAEHLNSSGGFKLSKLKYVGKDYFMKMKSGIIQEDDIIIVKDGATTAKVSYVDHTFPLKVACTNEHVFILRLNKQVLSKYVFYHLFGPIGQRQILEDFRGATVGGISKGFTKKVKFNLPPLNQQKKIAAILDEADAYRQKTKALIAKYDELTQSLFLDMFGVERRIKESWNEVKIKDIVSEKKGSMRTGPFGSDLLHREFVSEGISVLGIDNAVLNKFQWKKRRFITEKKYEDLKRYTVFPNDVIITIMGTVGRVAVVPENIGTAINTKHLAAITLNRELANPEFIAYALHSDTYVLWQIQAQGRGAIMKGLNLTIIKELKLFLPPIHMQNQFEKRVNAIDGQKEQALKNLLQSENLFNSLLQKAFKGELTN